MTLDRHQLALQVIKVLEEPLTQDGYELLDVRLFEGGGRLTVRVFLDDHDGLTLDACALASRTIGMLMEEADLFPDAYVIEVSSPGVRRPLRTDAHLASAIGQNVVLKVQSGDSIRTLKGELLAATEKTLNLSGRSEDDPIREIARSRVREASLDQEFDPRSLIAEDRRRRKDEKKQAAAKRRDKRKG